MKRVDRSFLLAAAGIVLAGSVLATEGDENTQNRLREAYRTGFRRGRAAAMEQVREMSDSRVELARRLLTARRAYEDLSKKYDDLQAELASCSRPVIAPGGDPEDVAEAPDEPSAEDLIELSELPSSGGPFGIPTGGGAPGVATGEASGRAGSSGGSHGPTIEIHVSPMGDPRLLEAGARGVVAGVQRDVNVVGSVAREGLGVAGTVVREQGELLETGVGAVGTVAGGYADAFRGLGEERSVLGHVGHTVTSIGGGWVQAGRDVGGQVLEGHREVWGRAWDGAQEVGSTWWDGTQHLAEEVLSPFRSESD